MENALNVVKSVIFKKIIKLTLLKRFTVIPFNPQIAFIL